MNKTITLLIILALWCQWIRYKNNRLQSIKYAHLNEGQGNDHNEISQNNSRIQLSSKGRIS